MFTKGIAILALGVLITLSACDPGVGTEGVNPDLPIVKFAFSITPATKWLSVGDTFDMYSSVSKVLPGNIILSAGSATIDATIAYTADTVFTSKSPAIGQAVSGIDYEIIPIKGTIKCSPTYPNVLSTYISQLEVDSFTFHYKVVFKKKGLFIFDIRPSFMETSNGRARTDAYFAVEDAHWSFFSGLDTPKYGTSYYNIDYHLGVR
jgi:hypothetical protein